MGITMTSSPKTPGHATSPISVPLQSARPSEVQTYFTSLLSTLHSVPASEAREIASKWKLGRGQEMSSFDVETYRQIFGWEAGTILFGHANGAKVKKGSGVKVQLNEKDKTKKDIFGLEPGLSIIYLCFFSTIFLGWRAYIEADDARAGFMAMFAGMLLMGFGASYCIFYFG